MKGPIGRRLSAVTALCLLATAFVLPGCGGSGGKLSSEVVSGVAAVGQPLAGQVALKDSSNPPREKLAVVDKDGSFAFDVGGMTPPYVLQARGSAEGNEYRLHSYAEGTGTANVNPLTDLIVALAAEVEDPSDAYADDEKRKKIGSNISRCVDTVRTKLQPLLARYGAHQLNPMTSKFVANHLDLDQLFDQVKITVAAGSLSIINKGSGAVIYSGTLSDIASGSFSPENVPAAPGLPAPPTGVSAVGGAGQTALAWASVSNATSYNIYYATSPGVTIATGTRIAAATNGHLHSGLSAGTTFYYIVTAVNSSGESAPSPQFQGTSDPAPPVPTVPAAPTGVTAAGGSRQATISWPAVTGATSYNVYWSATPGVTSANGTKLANAASPAVQGGLSDSTTYFYIVTAVNGAGEGAASIQVAASTVAAVPAPTAPAAVINPSAAGGANRVTLSWPAVTAASSYNIYWSNSPGVTTTTGTRISGATSPYVHTGLSAGAGYYYVVTAQNGVGESPASAQAAATTNAPPPSLPAAPTGVSASGGSNQVSLSWQAVSGAGSYNLYWSTTSGVTTATGTKITSVGSPYLQTGLSAGSTFYYIVTAVNGAGEGPASTRATASTNAPPVVIPVAPTGVTVSGGSNQATLFWPGVPAATSYNIYYSASTGVTKSNGSKVSNATAPYLQSGLAAGTTYYFIVTAVNSAGESAASAQLSATTLVPVVLDGLALYNRHCAGCHGTGKLGRTAAAILGAINANIGGMGSLGTLTSEMIAAIATTAAPAPAPTPACGSCHAIPPATGMHEFHTDFVSCATCHGAGYSSTTVNAATHANGVKNLGSTPGWNAASRTCANDCHGTQSW
ncbi:MAG: hypothetical protein A2075_24910 [Geobacteraceae bacterium GWC2_58_44]|nr:MAG: hypothetical protein A2075_24910 [Geobacteraceae bacterium GWC2_58_44]HBG06532.1 hypothetical protein [Geobacter sp.]